jgi:hypothetical protein
MAEQSPPERAPTSERDLVERHLGRAWRSFAPDAGLQDRVRARLTSSAAATMGAIGTGAAMRVRPEGTWASLQSSSKLGTALVGAGLLALGLLVGYLLRGAWEEPAPPPPLPPAPLSAEAVLAPSPSLEAPAIVAEVTPPAVTPAVTSVPRAERRAQQRGKAAAPAAGAGARSAAPATTEPGQELALLRRAEHAVRKADSALALALIAELQQRYPRSSLLEERRAVELLAYCVAGATDARDRAQRFLREHPRSVHAGRIAEQCAGAGELSPTGR